MSESERIAALTRLFRTDDPRVIVGSGDDAAVVRPAGAVAVTSVDAVVDGVHFQRSRHSLQSIGRRAVVAALSDLAAMAADPGEIYVAAGLPDDLSDEGFTGLAEGMRSAATDHGALVCGGDLTRADQLWLSVTVVGYAAEGSTVQRDGAREGDVVVVTGSLGRQAAHLADDAEEKPIAARFEAGKALAAHGATAMIDVSDGLARDAGLIAAASGHDITVRLADLPAESVSSEIAATSGEEYELIATLPRDRVSDARAAMRVELTEIGFVGSPSEQPLLQLLGADGVAVELRGWEHFD